MARAAIADALLRGCGGLGRYGFGDWAHGGESLQAAPFCLPSSRDLRDAECVRFRQTATFANAGVSRARHVRFSAIRHRPQSGPPNISLMPSGWLSRSPVAIPSTGVVAARPMGFAATGSGLRADPFGCSPLRMASTNRDENVRRSRRSTKLRVRASASANSETDRYIFSLARRDLRSVIAHALLRPTARLPGHLRSKRTARTALAATVSKWSGVKSSPTHSFWSA